MKAEDIQTIVEKHSRDQGALIAILEDIQARYSYLPKEALEIVAQKTGHPLVDVYGVATFFKAFSLKPRGKHLCSVCVGTACHVRGAPRVAEEFQRTLGVKPGSTTTDKEFTLETVNCLGACALGPITVMDGHYFSNVNPNRVKDIIEKTRTGLTAVDIKTDQRVFPVEVSCARCNHSLMEPGFYIDGHPAIRVTASFERTHGWVRLSSLYGSYSVESEHPIPMDTVVHFFCPHCHGELSGAGNCVECNAPMVPMMVRGGGVVQICSRRGCRGHMLDLDGVNA